MDYLLDLSSDEDYELINEVLNVRRERVINIRICCDDFDDVDIIERFRLSKQCFEQLLNEVRNDIQHPSERNEAVTAETQLLLTLRFYASGNMLLTVADFGGVAKSTASNIIRRVSSSIASLRPRYIDLSTNQDTLQEIAEGFFNLARFPRVVGALDCTHVRIQSPGGDNAEYFRNRKGYFSLNIQAICDNQLKFNNIVARWPGSSHDSNIFTNSRIRANFENGDYVNYLLLGDSGYPIKPYLLTPLSNPQTRAEHLYNESQIRTRNCIERAFGVWKRRFPILSLGIRVNIETAQDIIVATAVVHNIARSMNENDPFEEQINDELIPEIQGNNDVHQGDNLVRRNLINNYFARM